MPSPWTSKCGCCGKPISIKKLYFKPLSSCLHFRICTLNFDTIYRVVSIPKEKTVDDGLQIAHSYILVYWNQLTEKGWPKTGHWSRSFIWKFTDGCGRLRTFPHNLSLGPLRSTSRTPDNRDRLVSGLSFLNLVHVFQTSKQRQRNAVAVETRALRPYHRKHGVLNAIRAREQQNVQHSENCFTWVWVSSWHLKSGDPLLTPFGATYPSGLLEP